jgi:putative OPT family oligopeptide transporter
MLLGVSLSAVVIAPILSLLYNAYGIGEVFPRPGMDPNHSLAAPQATMMHALVKGAFSYQLPWTAMGIGCLIGMSCILLDYRLKKTIGMRLPVLAVGSGIYLPDVATSAIVLGGFISGWINLILKKRVATQKKQGETQQQRGLSAACGLVAGATLMGVALAIPFALFQSTEVLRIMSYYLQPGIINGMGIVSALGVLYWLYRVVCK